MLEPYPEFRSRDIRQIQAAVAVHAQGDRAEVPAGHPHDEFIVNAARFDEAALIFRSFDGPMTLGFRPADYIRLIYRIRDAGEVAIEGSVVENASSEAGYLVPNKVRWEARHLTGFRSLCFRVDAETLRRKLSALLDSECATLDLRQPADADPRRARLLRQSVFQFARELEAAEPRFVPTLAANSIEAISLRLLNAMSGPLVVEAARRPAAPSVAQLGRVEAYLVANFAEPVSVEKLAEISGVSARSVFAHFLSRYGCTPEGYLLPIRLEMARLTLRSCHDRDAIGAVALQCGFHSLRQFEHAYRNRFGAMPSADLP
jgi:AraC-like DNA-binding protein